MKLGVRDSIPISSSITCSFSYYRADYKYEISLNIESLSQFPKENSTPQARFHAQIIAWNELPYIHKDKDYGNNNGKND